MKRHLKDVYQVIKYALTFHLSIFEKWCKYMTWYNKKKKLLIIITLLLAVGKYTEAKFSHSICPSYMEEHFPEEYKSIEMDIKTVKYNSFKNLNYIKVPNRVCLYLNPGGRL